MDHTEKFTLVLPSHSVQYDCQMSRRRDNAHRTGRLVWSTVNETLHGFEYIYDVQNGQDDSYTLVVRRIGDQSQTLASHYRDGNGGTQKVVQVDIDHSHDASRRIAFKVIHQHNDLKTVSFLVFLATL